MDEIRRGGWVLFFDLCDVMGTAPLPVPLDEEDMDLRGPGGEI